MIVPAIVTLSMGVVLGYLAQRSRICFIGGLRDFLLIRDTELLKGAITFFLTAFLAFSAANALGLVDLGALSAQGHATGVERRKHRPEHKTACGRGQRHPAGCHSARRRQALNLADRHPCRACPGSLLDPGQRLSHAPTRAGCPGLTRQSLLPGRFLCGRHHFLPDHETTARALPVTASSSRIEHPSRAGLPSWPDRPRSGRGYCSSGAWDNLVIPPRQAGAGAGISSCPLPGAAKHRLRDWAHQIGGLARSHRWPRSVLTDSERVAGNASGRCRLGPQAEPGTGAAPASS